MISQWQFTMGKNFQCCFESWDEDAIASRCIDSCVVNKISVCVIIATHLCFDAYCLLHQSNNLYWVWDYLSPGTDSAWCAIPWFRTGLIVHLWWTADRVCNWVHGLDPSRLQVVGSRRWHSISLLKIKTRACGSNVRISCMQVLHKPVQQMAHLMQFSSYTRWKHKISKV